MLLLFLCLVSATLGASPEPGYVNVTHCPEDDVYFYLRSNVETCRVWYRPALDSPCHIPCQMSACVFFEELSPLECPVYEHVPRSHVGAILGGVSGLLAVLVLGGLVWWKRDYIRDRIPYGRMNNAGAYLELYPLFSEGGGGADGAHA